jgi:thiopeptide-type bacteriocin biosynthesis protein
LYRCVDALLIRAAVHPNGLGLPPWPDLNSCADTHLQEWRDWLREVWSRESFADAVALASPVLAEEVSKVCSGHPVEPRKLRRIVLSVARYVLRMTGRATPFGLFSGIAPARLGEGAVARWGEHHRATVRLDAEWLASVVARLENCPRLLRRLPVVANNVRIIRADRLMAPYQPQIGESAVADISVRHTRATQVVTRLAQSPVVFDDLATRVAVELPQANASRIERLLTELVRQAMLLTSLRPPMTVTDPLGHILDQLNAVGRDAVADVIELVHGLRRLHDEVARHSHATSSNERRQCRVSIAAQMRQIDTGASPIMVDLRLDTDVALPHRVAREAEAAAAALARLTPYPGGMPIWQDYHTAFLERYGIGAVVPVLELVNADTGLGLPASYRGSVRAVPSEVLSIRDEQLMALAQTAAIGGENEVVLTDRLIDRIAGEIGQVPPHVELFMELHAPTACAIDRGEYTLVVAGASRAAGTTTGRFLDLLDAADQSRFRAMCVGASAIRVDALPVQVSCPTMLVRTQSVARAPVMHSAVVPVAEFYVPAGNTIRLDDLAVGGDAAGLFLVSMSTQRLVEPTMLNSVEFRYYSHPLARFLCEVTRARAAVYMSFSWGAASSLPFLPRVRYGRSVLMPSRWHLTADGLPDHQAPWTQWRDALTSWRRRYRLPDAVFLVEADNRLRLDLDQELHQLLLRSRLDRHGNATLDEAPAANAFGWLGGRSHEVVVPLTSIQPAVTSAFSKAATSIAVTARDHAQLPGCSTCLYAKLYLHPARFREVLRRIASPMTSWGDRPPLWWYLPYLDPEPHLRLRLRLSTAEAYGSAAQRVGAWADELRREGLIGRMQLDSYYPETGRYGSGLAMVCAESVFATDSAVALAEMQMADEAEMPLDAVTAAGLVDLAVSFAGSFDAGMSWLIRNLAHEPAPMNRSASAAARRLVDPADDWAVMSASDGGDAVVRSWRQRAAALAAYREQLACQRDPLTVLPSLLHLHHVRTVGIDPERERLGRRLARGAALRWSSITERFGR